MKKNDNISHYIIYFLGIIYIFISIWIISDANAKILELENINSQLESEINNTDTDVQEFNNIVYTDRDINGEYIKIQDRMSMDFSSEDVRYIYAFIDARGGSVEDRALNMVIMLNNIYDTRQSIKEYVTQFFGAYLSFEFKDIKADKEAYEMVAYNHWDESNGERWFRK